MCETESLCFVAEINTTLLINYTSIKKKIHEQRNYAKGSKVLRNKQRDLRNIKIRTTKLWHLSNEWANHIIFHHLPYKVTKLLISTYYIYYIIGNYIIDIVNSSQPPSHLKEQKLKYTYHFQDEQSQFPFIFVSREDNKETQSSLPKYAA